MRLALIALFLCFAIQAADKTAPPVPKATEAPKIPDALLNTYYRLHSAAMDAQAALESTPQYIAAQQAQSAQMPAIQELVKACGPDHTPQPTKDSIICAEKLKPPAPEKQMPFRSKAQQRFLESSASPLTDAQKREWEGATNFKTLPDKKKPAVVVSPRGKGRASNNVVRKAR